MIYICSPNYFIYKEMKEKDSMEWKVLSSQYISQDAMVYTVRKKKKCNFLTETRSIQINGLTIPELGCT